MGDIALGGCKQEKALTTYTQYIWLGESCSGWAMDVDPIGLGREECWVLEPTDINHMEA